MRSRPRSSASIPSHRKHWRAGSRKRNAAVVRAVLTGEEGGAARTAVLINAAAAFQVAGRTDSLADGVAAAAESIDSGAAAAALDRLIRASRRAAAARG